MTGLSPAAAMRRLLRRSPPGILATDLAACDAYAGAAAAAARLRLPALLVCGAEDRMTPPEKAAALAAMIPGARTVTLPAAGHMMMLEDPAGSLAALETLL
jgi:pimeloyl-ACP methyl ester carboxylesterase